MPAFRRKRFVIQARRVRENEGEIKVSTFGRDYTVQPGEWIVGDPDGQQYRMKDYIFRELYEPVDEEAKRELDSTPEGPG